VFSPEGGRQADVVPGDIQGEIGIGGIPVGEGAVEIVHVAVVEIARTSLQVSLEEAAAVGGHLCESVQKPVIAASGKEGRADVCGVEIFLQTDVLVDGPGLKDDGVAELHLIAEFPDVVEQGISWVIIILDIGERAVRDDAVVGHEEKGEVGSPEVVPPPAYVAGFCQVVLPHAGLRHAQAPVFAVVGDGCSLGVLLAGVSGLKGTVVEKFSRPEVAPSCQVEVDAGHPVEKPGGVGLLQVFLVDEDKADVGAGEDLFLKGGHRIVAGEVFPGFFGGHVHHSDAGVSADFSAETGSCEHRGVKADPARKEGSDRIVAES